jgi:hypothetical protein
LLGMHALSKRTTTGPAKAMHWKQEGHRQIFKSGCLVAGVSSRIHYQGIVISVPCFLGIAKLQECEKRDDI